MNREHVGQGARKAARRKLRHALRKTKLAELSRLHLFSPAALKFQARIAVDRELSQGSTDKNAHGRGLVRKNA